VTGQEAPGRDGGPLVEVRGLRVDYGLGPDAVHAVIDADLTLVSGAVLGLAGESGSGKSTLAYAMTRLLRAPGIITGGQVLLHGGTGPAGEPVRAGAIDLLAADERQLRGLRWSRIAVVMQSAMHALNPVVTIGAQLTDVLQAHRLKMDKTDRRQRAAFLLEMVGISADNLRRYPHQLSGGMRQRVMIAMALALEPAVVIMDEPTTALDVVTQREILTELAALQRDLSFAVLFITHDLSLLVELADSIAVMYAGRLLEQAAAGDLYRAPRHPYTLGLLRSFPPLHGARKSLTGIPGSPPDLRTPPPGCPFHPRCGYAMDVCRTEMPAAFRLRGPGDRALAPPSGAPPARRGAGHPRPDGKAEKEPIVELSATTATPPGGMRGHASPAVLLPGSLSAGGGRSAACWLHDGAHEVPAELAVPEPGTPSPGAVTETGIGPVAGTRTSTGTATETGTRTSTGTATETGTRTESGAGSETEAGAQPAAVRLTAAMPPGTAAAPDTTGTLR
jgi:peptide/nickel transport system ATP-binding protein